MHNRRPRSRVSTGALERGLADLAAAERAATRRRAVDALRAVHEERLRRLEQDLTELRGRLNGLLFLAAGAVVTQVILRLIVG
jgi:hypothetical protein